MQTEFPWSVEYVRARLGVQVTKYEVLLHLKRSAQEPWLAKRQLQASAEQLVQLLSDQDVMKLYEDFFYTHHRLTQGSLYSERSSTPKSGSEANFGDGNRVSFRSVTPDLPPPPDPNELVDGGPRRYSTSMMLPPALAEHVAERTIFVHRSYSSPAVDFHIASNGDEPTDVPQPVRTHSMSGEISTEPRSRNVLGRVREGFMRMMGRRGSDADDGPAPAATPTGQQATEMRAPSPHMQRLPSPHVSPQQSRSRIEDSFTLEVDPSAMNTVGPDFPPAQGLPGHTVYTKVWMGGHSQRGPKKTANEDRFFAIADLNAYSDEMSLTQPKIAFAGVFDGHGGALAAEFCRNRLPVLASRSPHFDDLDKDLANILAATMQDIVDEMEEDLRDCCDQYNDTSGACAALVLFRGGRLCVANLGDCQVYVCDDLGKIHCMSVAHRCSNPAEVERLQKAQAPIKGDRVLGVLEPTRSFGDFDLKSENPLSVIHTPFMLTAIVRKAKPMTTRPLLQQEQLADLQTSIEPGSRRSESKPLGRRRRSLSFLTRPLARSNVPKRSPPPSPRQEENVDDAGRDAGGASSQPSSAGVPTLKKTESWYARAKKSTEGGASGVGRLLSITKPGLKRNHSTSTLKAMNKGQAASKVNPFVVLATDGVWDTMKVHEAMLIVHDALQAGESPESAAQALVQAAIANGSQDDTTAVVMLLK